MTVYIEFTLPPNKRDIDAITINDIIKEICDMNLLTSIMFNV